MEAIDEGVSDAELEQLVAGARAREREVKLEMQPLEERLGAVRRELEGLYTEQRRRERSKHVSTRAWVRASVQGREFPSLEEVLATDAGPAGDTALGARRYYLGTGGEIGLGFPGASTQTLSFTDGARNETAADFGTARRLFADGLEVGTTIRAGVRVHFAGTRQEKLVGADEVFVGQER